MGAIKVWDGTSWQVAAGAGAAVWVGPEAPTGTAKAGDQWFDTDDPNMLPLPLVVASGGTGATTAAAARTSLGVPDVPVTINQGGTGATAAAVARTNLAVPAIGNSTGTAGAPTTGTWVRGDQWLDSANVVWTCTIAGTPGTWVPPPGYEYAYNQITSTVALSGTNPAFPHLVIEGTSRSYDGSPVIVEFYSPIVQAPASAPAVGTIVNLWDGATDIGMIADVLNPNGATNMAVPVFARRRIAPTPGTHNYRIQAWVQSSTGSVYAGPGGVAGLNQGPAYIRVIRA